MKSILRAFLAVLAIAFMGNYALAQTGVKGVVKDANTGERLVGAAIKVSGTNKGTITNSDGAFMIETPAGNVSLEVTYLGYETVVTAVNVQKGSVKNIGRVQMEAKSIGLGGVSIIADRAKERETPVAVSNIDAKQLEFQLGSRDLPMIMNNTPSVYATAQGGGAGDARINVRGFNQRNVAIMINGVPVNDMENGWVYWSNWDGISDATSSIQMQRGLSAVNLATPSIGGTMNIITSPAEQKAGVVGKFEFGSGNFMKETITLHSGRINEKFAVSASVVRKTGDGVIDGTWTDAWAYYLGTSYDINKNHRIEFFAMGAPQRHGQNLYKQNVAAYDSAYAREIGADSAVIHKFTKASDRGRLYNENWNEFTTSYDGKQYWNTSEHDRYASNFINERENYYHKPLANLNWYAKWTDKLSQYTTVYYSGGQGGGTGTYGSVKWDYASEPSRIIDIDATLANNNPSDTAFGILRNSVNNQTTFGGISKLKIKVSDKLQTQVGLDWRTAEIEHYREVRDLLGGSFFVYDGNEFDATPADHQKGLGDKIAYNNTNTVNWFGGFAQAEYSTDQLTAYGTVGASTIKYTYRNHFMKDDNGNELTSESDNILGWQAKGGLSYRPMNNLSVFGNVGLISKVPIFDNVIDDGDGTVSADPANESFTSFEIGAIYSTNDDNFNAKANLYYTDWKDRAFTRSVNNQDGSDGIIFLSGLNQNHTGIELEVNYRPMRILAVGAIASFGNWTYTSDVEGQYKDYSGQGGADTNITYKFYTNGLKVGDAPQTQIGFWVDLYPVKGLQLQGILRYNANHYADYDPLSRTDASDLGQVWLTPSYMLVDFHASYDLPIKGRFGVQVFGHVFNLLDEMYIQDATDNSRFNGYYGADGSLSHTANSAEVFLGLPRTFNVGVRLKY